PADAGIFRPVLYHLSYLPNSRGRIADAHNRVYWRPAARRYSTAETTPRRPYFSKTSVTMTTSPVLSSRVRSERATRSPDSWSRTRVAPGTVSRSTRAPFALTSWARLA